MCFWWNEINHSDTKCSSLIVEHEEQKISRALELVNALQLDKAAAKTKGKHCREWIEVPLRIPLSPEIVLNIISWINHLVQRTLFKFTPAIIVCFIIISFLVVRICIEIIYLCWVTTAWFAAWNLATVIFSRAVLEIFTNLSWAASGVCCILWLFCYCYHYCSLLPMSCLH